MLSHFSYWLGGIVPQTFRDGVAAQSWWLQVIEVVLLSDFLIYWAIACSTASASSGGSIRCTSAEHLDWLAAHREHPLDTTYTVGLINLPAFILGFPLETLADSSPWGVWAIYIHSNVRLPIGPLRMLIGAPNSTTGTTTALGTRATTPTFLRSWTFCSGRTAARTMNRNNSTQRASFAVVPDYYGATAVTAMRSVIGQGCGWSAMPSAVADASPRPPRLGRRLPRLHYGILLVDDLDASSLPRGGLPRRGVTKEHNSGCAQRRRGDRTGEGPVLYREEGDEQHGRGAMPPIQLPRTGRTVHGH